MMNLNESVRRSWVIGLLVALTVGCQERKPVPHVPKKEAPTPIERYLRQHFDNGMNDMGGQQHLPEAGDQHYWVVDSLSVKSLQATVYRISQLPDKRGSCLDCRQHFVIRNNRSGACFRFYRSGWGDNDRTGYEEIVLNESNYTRLFNHQMLGLEAFLNERYALATIASIDTILRYAGYVDRRLRIRTQAQLDSVCHYPAAKSALSLRKLLLPCLRQNNVLLYYYCDDRYVVVDSYTLSPTLPPGSKAPVNFQYGLVHVTLDRRLDR